MAKWLTKSDYMKWLVHPAYLWLQKHDKGKLPAFDESAQAMADQGYEIEAHAQSLFENGVEIVAKDMFEGIDRTEQVLKAAQNGPTASEVWFQPAVLTENKLYAKADIMRRRSDGKWDIFEVKSSTKVKADYLHDLAFQKVAFEASGYQIGSLNLIHVDQHYERGKEIEPKKFLKIVDATEMVEGLIGRTKKGIESARKVIEAPVCPNDDPIYGQDYYGWRDIYRYLHPEIEADSIYNLCRLNLAQLKALAKLGLTKLKDIPLTMELKPHQTAQLRAVQIGRPIVHPLKIAHQLEKLKWPLYFLDYETVFPAVPLYVGTRPYQQIPFQYSLHVLDGPEANLRQTEFLAKGLENPMPALLAQLKRDVGSVGSVVVWNKAFEMSVNDNMAAHYREYSEFLENINRRVFDLMEIFSNHLYNDAHFLGSASIKKVLPVLVPELSYAGLNIGEGMLASRRWYQTATGQLEEQAAERVYQDLLEYCGQDTLAMVRIYEVLSRLVKNSIPEQMSML